MKNFKNTKPYIKSPRLFNDTARSKRCSVEGCTRFATETDPICWPHWNTAPKHLRAKMSRAKQKGDTEALENIIAEVIKFHEQE